MNTARLDQVFKLLTGNEEFLTQMKTSISHIVKDGKIDSHDIPEIVFIATKAYNDIQNIEVTEDELPILLKMMITFFINKLDLFPENIERQLDLEKMVDVSIQLLLIRPKVKKSFLVSLCSCFFTK